MRSFCGRFVKRYEILILIVLLILISLTAVKWADQKSGLYVDEGMTLYLSNGNYNGAVTTDSEYTLFDFLEEYVWKGDVKSTAKNIVDMIQSLKNGGNYSIEGSVEWYDKARRLLQGSYAWLSDEELFEQIAVTPGTGFQYGQVLVNQAMDVHPPFYYLFVHTVFSFCPGTCTKWHLFSVNIIFLLATLILVFYVTDRYFNNRWMAFLSVVLLGFSQGFLSCAVYFRMYAMLTFFVVAAFAAQLRLMDTGFDMKGKNRWVLVITTVLGFYTHYYFILFLVGVALLNVLSFIRKRQFSNLAEYLKIMVLSGIISFLIWPFSLYHIFFGYRGREAVTKLAADGFIKNAGEYLNVLAKAFCGGSKWVLALGILVLVFLTIAVFLKKRRRDDHEERFRRWAFAIIPSLFYGLLMVQITPVCEDRYLMCIFPFIAMIFAWSITTLSGLLREKRWKWFALISLSLVWITLNCKMVPNYLYLEQKEKTLTGQGRNCIMLLADDGYGYQNVLELIHYPQTLVMTYKDVASLSDLTPDNPERGFMIYIHDGLGTEELLEDACEALRKSLGNGKEIESMEEVECKFEYMRAFTVDI